MERFCIITNRIKDPELKTTTHMRTYLEAHGASCQVQLLEGGAGRGLDVSQIPDDTDCVLVLGGDGTLLQAARELADKKIPLLGVNLGTLGYLAEIEKTGIDSLLPRLLRERFETEARMMLTGRILRGGRAEQEADALNDIVVTRSEQFQLIHYHILVNGQSLHHCHADGIVVSTPTGSTGYNLSAGGPIVEPEAHLLLLTPICSHTPGSRSIVLSPEDVVTIEIAAGKDGGRQQAEAHFDGGRQARLQTGDRIEIRRSERETRILKVSRASFLETLHRKMGGDGM